MNSKPSPAAQRNHWLAWAAAAALLLAWLSTPIALSQSPSSPQPPTAPKSPCAPTGQGGTVSFANRVISSGINARIFMEDGSTPVEGDAYLAQLYISACENETNLQPADKPTPFRKGPAAGYITSRTLTLETIAPRSPAFAQLRCWDAKASTYEQAVAQGLRTGKSNVIRFIAGGAAPGALAGLPPDLIGLKGFALSLKPQK